MTKKRRGFCLIINNEDFDNEILSTRRGSSVDAQNLLDLFSQLGFQVGIDIKWMPCVNALNFLLSGQGLQELAL